MHTERHQHVQLTPRHRCALAHAHTPPYTPPYTHIYTFTHLHTHLHTHALSWCQPFCAQWHTRVYPVPPVPSTHPAPAAPQRSHSHPPAYTHLWVCNTRTPPPTTPPRPPRSIWMSSTSTHSSRQAPRVHGDTPTRTHAPSSPPGWPKPSLAHLPYPMRSSKRPPHAPSCAPPPRPPGVTMGGSGTGGTKGTLRAAAEWRRRRRLHLYIGLGQVMCTHLETPALAAFLLPAGRRTSFSARRVPALLLGARKSFAPKKDGWGWRVFFFGGG